MTNEEYHAAPGVSKTHLDEIDGKSDLHYWHKYENPDADPVDASDPQKFGIAVHSAILEPHIFESHFASDIAIPNRSNADRFQRARHQARHHNKILVSPDDFDYARRIRDRVHAHPIARGLLTGGVAESTYFARDDRHGELIKCRPDYLTEHATIDIKSARDASPDGFGRDADRYRYDVQAFWYPYVRDCLKARKTKHFIWIAIEKEPPFAIGIYYATPMQIENARVSALSNYDRIINCRRRNQWPDYGHEPQALQLPTWSKRGRQA